MQLTFRILEGTKIWDTMIQKQEGKMKKNTHLSEVKNNPDVVFLEYC